MPNNKVDPNAETVRMTPIRRVLARELFRLEAFQALAEKTEMEPALAQFLRASLIASRAAVNEKIRALDKLEDEEKLRCTPDALVSTIANDFFNKVVA